MLSPCLRVGVILSITWFWLSEAESLGTEEESSQAQSLGPSLPEPVQLGNRGSRQTPWPHPQVHRLQNLAIALKILTLHLLAVSR